MYTNTIEGNKPNQNDACLQLEVSIMIYTQIPSEPERVDTASMNPPPLRNLRTVPMYDIYACSFSVGWNVFRGGCFN